MVEEIGNDVKNCFKCNGIFNISLCKPKAFYGGESLKVMIIGHSPTVRVSEKAEVVLKMDKPNGELYKYIYNDIIQPLGINIENLYCTNLIKCFTNNLPEEINKVDKMYINNVFNNCSELLEKEIEVIKPKLIISLSGRVLEILSERYMCRKLKIKNCFGKLYKLNIANMSIQYIPVIHIPKYKKVKDYYVPEQTQRLYLVRHNLDIFKT